MKILQTENVQIRLQQIFSKCLSNADEEFFFEYLVKDKVLSFHFNQGVDKDPDFSGPVRATLLLDQKKNFLLRISSLQNGEKHRIEKLLSNVETIDFRFYDSKQLKWVKNLEDQEKSLPYLIKIKLKKDGKDVEYAYLFLQSFFIRYEKL